MRSRLHTITHKAFLRPCFSRPCTPSLPATLSTRQVSSLPHHSAKLPPSHTVLPMPRSLGCTILSWPACLPRPYWFPPFWVVPLWDLSSTRRLLLKGGYRSWSIRSAWGHHDRHITTDVFIVLNFWAVEYATQGFVCGKHSSTSTKRPSHGRTRPLSYVRSTTDKSTCRSELHVH